MEFRAFIASSLFLTGITGALAQAPNSPTTLTLTQKTEVPGESLSPGTYTVRIEDRLKDRMVVEVQKEGSKKASSLLAYPDPELTSSAPGPIPFSSGLKNKPTLRGFAFPGGTVAEFIYPKKDAVALATANNVQVMAVDPASQGMESLPHLAPSEMSEVTLWMLTPSPVQPGSDKPGIQAARYQAPAPVAPAPPAPVMAQNTPPPPPPAPASNAAAPPPPPPPAPPAPVETASSPAPSQTPPVPPATTTQVASNEGALRIHARVRELPHTASDLPELELAGVISLVAAFGLRRRSKEGSKA